MDKMRQLLERDQNAIVQVYSPERVVFDHAENVTITDIEGKEYLDFSAQYSSCSIGHAHSEMIHAITAQMHKLLNITSMFVTEERVTLAEKLIEISPAGLDKVLLGCTGSDANEFALKAAKYYKGGGKIFSFWRGFHGSTGAAAAVTGKSETIQQDTSISELLPRGFIHTSPAYCYRCDFGKEPDNCCFQCLKYLEKQILHEGGAKVAAIMTEPVFAAGGVIVPPKNYFAELRNLCDKYGILLIFDEVVTGFGQTGKMFAAEHFDVTPDILSTGKALTGGYIPGSAVLMRKEIGEAMDPLTLHGHTHSFYPGVCAAALKNIEIIQRDHLVENAAVVGQYLQEGLCGLMNKYPQIGDVRGLGLLQGIEIVKDRDTRSADYNLARRWYDRMLHNGLVTELESRANLENAVIVLHPPLTLSKRDVDDAIHIMDISMQEVIG